jgi:hypothetical protein
MAPKPPLAMPEDFSLHFDGSRPETPEVWGLFLVAFWIAVSIQRFAAYRRYKLGIECHTLYEGTPWVMYLFPQISDNVARRFINPVVLCWGGAALSFHFLDEGFGNYLVWAGLGMFGKGMAQEFFWRKRIEQIRNAKVEHDVLRQEWHRPHEAAKAPEQNGATVSMPPAGAKSPSAADINEALPPELRKWLEEQQS